MMEIEFHSRSILSSPGTLYYSRVAGELRENREEIAPPGLVLTGSCTSSGTKYQHLQIFFDLKLLIICKERSPPKRIAFFQNIFILNE